MKNISNLIDPKKTAMLLNSLGYLLDESPVEEFEEYLHPMVRFYISHLNTPGFPKMSPDMIESSMEIVERTLRGLRELSDIYRKIAEPFNEMHGEIITCIEEEDKAKFLALQEKYINIRSANIPLNSVCERIGNAIWRGEEFFKTQKQSA